MARDLFSEVSTPSARFRSSSRWTIAISIAAHVAIVATVLIIPLMATDVLPLPDAGSLHFIPAIAPPPAPPAPRMASARASTTPAPVNPNVAPINPPQRIEDEVLPEGTRAVGGVDLVGVTNGVPNGIGDVGAPIAVVAPPPPPQQPKDPLRIGGAIRAPVRVTNVAPIYPSIALRAHVSGKVTLDAVIDKDGSVRDVRVLSGVALLNQAAIDAVRQWRYTPTLLNGQAVQVVMTVTVDFRLD